MSKVTPKQRKIAAKAEAREYENIPVYNLDGEKHIPMYNSKGDVVAYKNPETGEDTSAADFKPSASRRPTWQMKLLNHVFGKKSND